MRNTVWASRGASHHQWAADRRGSPMAVSVRDVAAAASVSVGTVSNVLEPARQGRPGHGRARARRDRRARLRAQRRRPAAARRPQPLDRARRARRAQPVLHGCRARRRGPRRGGRHDRSCSATATRTPTARRAYLDLFEEQRVHGVLITPLTDDLPRLERLRARGTPVVLVDREAADRRSPRSPSTTSWAASSPGDTSPTSASAHRVRRRADRASARSPTASRAPDARSRRRPA